MDQMSAVEMVSLMHKEDAVLTAALGHALPQIARAASEAASAIRSGGTLVYAGSGTSGRLAVLDASEIMPTFGSRAFRAVIAGGETAMTEAVEGAEDDIKAGERAGAALSDADMAVGVTASGRTPFVLGFLRAARAKGARTWLVTCSDMPRDEAEYDGLISLLTGPELIAGSTRLKAGTATKMALNMLSTTAMTLLGGTYDGLMVDVVPTNEKLIKRACGIVMEISGCSGDEAMNALGESGMSPKTACLMLMKDMGPKEAEALLKESGGSLRKALRA